MLKTENPAAVGIGEPGCKNESQENDNAARQNNQGFLSIVTSETPRYLAKTIKLVDGRPVKEGAGQMINGTVEKKPFKNLNDLKVFVTGAGSNQALCFGCCEFDKAAIVTKKNYKKDSGRAVVARTLDFFKWMDGPAVWFLDVDGRQAKTAEQVRAEILEVVPELKDAPMLLRYSSGSGIYHVDREIIGAKGWHVFVIVADASDISRAGKAFFDRSWLVGMGFVEISSAGSFLIRGPVDASVWQANRFAFVGPAICRDGLTQKRPAPILYNDDAPPFETVLINSLTPTEETTLADLQRKAKREKIPEAQAVRERWATVQLAEALEKEPDADEDRRAELTRVFNEAITQSNLFADFFITLNDGAIVSVHDILDAPDKYHEVYCHDPLELDAGPSKARIYTREGGKRYIWSYLHGGRKFLLIRARKTVQIMAGERYRHAREMCKTARVDGTLYTRGGELTRLTAAGQIMPLNIDGLTLYLDSLLRFEKYNKKEDEWKPADCTRPLAIAAQCYARENNVLPELLAVARHPVIDPYNGRLINLEGHDAETGLLLWLNGEDWPGMPENPTFENYQAAADALYWPFGAFPFVDSVSRGVFIAAILTGVLRALLPTAPAFAISATAPGTGKTLLARCVALLLGLYRPPVMPGSGSDDELRKKLLAVLREGAQILIFDNLNGVIHSDILCAALTNESFKDRVLGVSETIEVSTRALIMLTGNNLTIGGDLCRRVLKSELDAEDETPWRRHFGFDPAAHCLEYRPEMVMAALTLLKGGIQNGPTMTDNTGSFSEWDQTIRKTICWLRDQEFLDVDDPAKAIDTAFDMDPETAKLSALLYAWQENFTTPVTVAHAMSTARTFATSLLFDALFEIGGEGRDSLNARRIGRWIDAHARRIVDGLFFVNDGRQNNVKTWVVKCNF